MNNFCRLLHGRIERKFHLQTEIKSLQWRLLQSGTEDEIQEEVEAKKAEIANIDAQISALVQRILRAPLCLLSLPDDSRLFLQRLSKAKEMLEELDVKSVPRNPDSVNGHVTEIERADELLKLDRQARPADWALVWLFRADVLHRQKKYTEALAALEQADTLLPEEETIDTAVMQLIRGNIWQNLGGGRFEGPSAWGDAARLLGRLHRLEAEKGNRVRGEVYRLLQSQLQREIETLRVWHKEG